MTTSRGRKLLEEAVQAGQERDYARSAALLTELLAASPDFPEALLYLGRARQALGELGPAIEAFRAYLRAREEAPEGWFFLGRALGAAERHAEAIQAFRRSLELDGGAAQTWALLGASLLKSKRTRLAVECLEKAVGFAPRDQRVRRAYLNALYARAARLVGRGEAELARQMLSYLLAEGYEGPGPRLWRARALRALGRPAEALADCESALAQSPGDEGLSWLRAGLLLEAGRAEEARAALARLGAPESVASGRGGEPRSAAELARLRALEAYRTGRYQEALSAVLPLTRDRRPDSALLAMAADCSRALGQYAKALELWERAVEADPRAPELKLGYAFGLLDAGKAREALATARAAVRSGADADEAALLELLALSRIGERPEALVAPLQARLGTCLRQGQAPDARLCFAMGESLYRSGEPDLARGWFDKVLSLEPRHELALLYSISALESLIGPDRLARLGDEGLEAPGRGREAELFLALRLAHEAYLEAYPDNETIRAEASELLARSGLWAECAALLEAGLAYAKPGPAQRRFLARALRESGRFPEAAVLYRDLLRESPADGELLLALALCLDKEGKPELALALLEKAPEAAKSRAAPWIVMGRLRARRGKTEGAVDALRRAVELDPGSERAWRDLAALYERQGLAAFAKDCAERAAAAARAARSRRRSAAMTR